MHPPSGVPAGQTHERILPLEGLFNVRDLGGYWAGSRRVIWRTLYRAGDLANLSPQAQGYLEGRALKTIVDFRDDEERRQAPDGNIGTVRKTYVLPIEAGSIIGLGRIDRGEDGEERMRELYRVMVKEARPQFRELFRLLLDPETTPLLFHCSAGKDRTGLCAALVLSALGVSREVVYRDYTLSQRCLRGKYDEWVRSAPRMEPIAVARLAYIQAAFSTIDDAYGGVEPYLRGELGADLERLRARYTEDISPRATLIAD